MCGIAGIIDRHKLPDSRAITSMIDGIQYRGPDAQGHICFEEGVALGHRRLSILDLSEAGNQPMASRDGRYWIVYNGEIYNYLEIKRDLEALGERFHSNCDTEVLLTAFACWGPACLQRFMGMYAFAIWDRHTRQLFAARDRIGIKPFYYATTKTGLIFGSEIKSLLCVSPERHGMDVSVLDSYMEFGYVPGEATMHNGIRRLLPGHTLTWQDGRTTTSAYWDFDFDHQVNVSLEGSAGRLSRLLEDSVALHLRSDVPVGVFLSGGLDSSTVVSMLSGGASAGLKTFSVAYELGEEFDETPYAREVAAAFSTDHHEVRMTTRDFLDFIPRFVHHMDEPVADSASISLYYVARLARQQVTVCLSGEGSDELFAGYDFYAYNLAIRRAQRAFGTSFFQRLGALFPPDGRAAKLGKYLRMAGQPLESRYRGTSTYEPSRKDRLYSEDFVPHAVAGNAGVREFIEGLFSRSRNWDPLSRMLYFDTKTWLVDDLLTKADRMSMASSIELRVPFLDHRVVELAATIPSRHKIRGADTKRVLKHAMRNRLPQRILRRRKMGFPTPIEVMFRGELFDYARDLLLSRAALARGFFNPAQLEKLLQEHRTGVARNHREIWQLIVLEEWQKQFGSAVRAS